METSNNLIQHINQAKQRVQSSPAIAQHIYDAMNGLGSTFLMYKHHNGQHGWARKVKNSNGKNMWTPTQADQLESLFHQKPQLGGAFNPSGFRQGVESDLIQTPGAMDVLRDFSFDETFYKTRDHIQQFNTTMKTLSQTLGPTSFVNGPAIQFQYGPMPGPISIPRRALYPLVITLLESLRMIVTFTPFQSDFIRQISSIVLAIVDLSSGDWKQAILSILGVYGETPLLFGVLAKMFLWVYNLISPEIQDRLEKDIFDSTKSAFVGFWLYILSIVSPDTIREKINALVQEAKVPLEQIQESLLDIETQLQPEAEKLGMKISFPRIPLDAVPSLDDIQNLQALLQQPAFACNPVVKGQLDGLRTLPALRLVLELMSVPTGDMCSDQPESIQEAAKKLIQPTFEPLSTRNNRSLTRANNTNIGKRTRKNRRKNIQ
jgi:hypothetical protein